MSRARVLIVEDEPDLAWVEQFNLETEGYEVKWAAEGRAAIEALDEFQPDVIVLDLMLPHVDGWAVLEKAQQLPTNERPTVIVVSAVAGMEERLNATYVDGSRFLAGAEDGSVLVRETATGKELARLLGYTGKVHSVAFGAKGSLAAAGCEDGTIRLWRLP